LVGVLVFKRSGSQYKDLIRNGGVFFITKYLESCIFNNNERPRAIHISKTLPRFFYKSPQEKKIKINFGGMKKKLYLW
jgi:hypothetical protein